MPSEWYVIRVHPRAEYLAAEELIRDGYEIFFPCVEVEYARVGHSDTPLFPGYMFIRFDLGRDGWPAFRTAHRVAGWVKFQGEVPTVPKEFVDALALRLDEKSGGQGLWRRFQAGDMVKVVAGALEGLGEVVEEAKTPKGRAKVMLEFMGRMVEAKVPWDSLQFSEMTWEKRRLPRRTRGMGRWTSDFRPSLVVSN
jgi:transcriptional antiterminator RfaH